ncbi:MAG: PFL_4703 family integrating conjugative element protein [Methylococcales bacterium]
MRYQDENSNLRQHIITLRWTVGGLVLLSAGLIFGWQQARGHLRIYIPPDLRTGAAVKSDELHPAHIYAFANTLFQQANHWGNGEKDYAEKIFKFSAYFTPTYHDALLTDMQLRGKNGELVDRTRTIQPATTNGFEDRRVAILSDNTWVVWLDFNIRESVKGMEVKNVTIRYPLRVVRYDIDLDQNPWGLALDGYYGEGPKTLKANEGQPLPELLPATEALKNGTAP